MNNELYFHDPDEGNKIGHSIVNSRGGLNICYESADYDDLYLMHHGVKGQKWGVRRYQNSDGTWTSLGKRRRQQNKGLLTKVNEIKSKQLADRIRSTRNKRKRNELRIKKARYDYRLKRTKELDKREQEYLRRHNANTDLAVKALTVGVVGGQRYRRYLAMLNGTNKRGITGKKMLASLASLGSRHGTAELTEYAYSRAGENDYIEALKRRQQKRRKNSK